MWKGDNIIKSNNIVIMSVFFGDLICLGGDFMNNVDLGNIRVVATDIDGTLTNREYLIDLEAITYIRLLEKNDIKVILITGHTFATVSTLSQYIGTSGPVVAENGCVIGYKWEPIMLGPPIDKKEEIIQMMENLGFKLTKSSHFKFIDMAFRRTDKAANITNEELHRILSSAGFEDLEISDSGFAVHIAPKGLNKGSGLVKALEMLNVSPSEALFIGDGENDIPAFKVVGVSVAVNNAPATVKKHADLVTREPYGKGFVEMAKMLLKKED